MWAGFKGNRHELAEHVNGLPGSPGVYVFRGEGGEILYVGKAINLKNRVRSYFGSNLPVKTEALMSRVEGLEIIVVDSEAEAFILESNLIKKHRPRYNILLRDDKQYPYLRINLNDQWPTVSVVRRMSKDGARYFGPFTRSGSVRETLSFLRRIFPYRTCSDRSLAQATRPCLNYHIGRCLGPCTGEISRDEYMETINEVVKFLEGRHKDVRKRLEKRMLELASNLDFENAARVRDRIQALDDVTERQKVVLNDMKDRDVLGLARSGKYAFVALLPVREGKLMGREGFVLTGSELDDDREVIRAFITQYYPKAPFVPREIVIPVALEDEDEINRYIGTKLRTPKRGVFKELVEMASENATAMMDTSMPKYKREAGEYLQAMEDLARALDLPGLPMRIEGYDISNISGKEAVASMVVLYNGKPEKSSYRRFRIKTGDKPNDVAMMQEALWRRFKSGLDDRVKSEGQGNTLLRQSKFAVFPDLVIVDGGKGQANAAKQVLDELGLSIPVAALAEKNEELFLPGAKEPIILARDSGALFLVIRLRDEAHRFALSYHRKLRKKKTLQSELSDIPGLGPARIRQLLSTFGSVDSIKKASLEDLQKSEGIGPHLARTIYEHFNKPQ
ncbi:MAG TPA: excinuclease ABC subunit UvrC [Firmicutes bacterium]|jgi:excinuclease ABC subunit C|nr:excinuclease ABC subunit UvrC [Candidatus Fermentithermobacillaceae bacterium]